MCFDCSNFQYQLDHKKPLEDHVFQTIFLNNKHSDTWQKDEIKKDKISESTFADQCSSVTADGPLVREDWWHQLCHSWTHYAFVVPFIWLLNRNSKHTTYAAAWTLVNAHEVAVISGKASRLSSEPLMCHVSKLTRQAAAYKLGADYPAELYTNSFAKLSFSLYLFLAHGMFLKKSRTSHF